MSLQLLKPGLLKADLVKPGLPESALAESGLIGAEPRQTLDKHETNPASFVSSIKKFCLGLSSMRKDQLRVFMQPHQLVFMRIKHDQRIVHKKIVAVAPPNQESESNEPSWTPLIQALREELRNAAWHGATSNRPKLQLLLSNHFVHYAVIPWHASLSNRLERQAFLRHSFSLAYGDTAKSWDLRMSDSGVNRPALASGIEQALLRDISQVVKEANMQLSGIYPHLMVAINQARQHAQLQTSPYASYWFAMLESGRWCVALIHEGNWHSVNTFAAAITEANDENVEDMRSQLSAYLARASVLSGIARQDLPAVVYWPGHRPSFNTLADGRAVLWINSAKKNSLHSDFPAADSKLAHAPASQALSAYETLLWA